MSQGLLWAPLKHLPQPGLQFCKTFFFGERRDPVSLGTGPALRPKHPCVFSNEQGFDFLGYRIRAGARLRPSAEGLRRLRERARQLYEREGDWHRLRQYLLRW